MHKFKYRSIPEERQLKGAWYTIVVCPNCFLHLRSRRRLTIFSMLALSGFIAAAVYFAGGKLEGSPDTLFKSKVIFGVSCLFALLTALYSNVILLDKFQGKSLAEIKEAGFHSWRRRRRWRSLHR